MKQFDTPWFLQRITETFGDSISLESDFQYIDRNQKTSALCKTHGSFDTVTGYLLEKTGCGECVKEKYRNVRKEKFLRKARNKYDTKYEYDIESFFNHKTKIKINCPIHGWFEQTPDKHLSPNAFGCTQCGRKCSTKPKIKKKPRVRITKNVFLEKAKKKFKNVFSYNILHFNDQVDSSVEVICPEHGSSLQIARNHLTSKTGCGECSKEFVSRKFRKPWTTLKSELESIHKDRDYNFPDYNNLYYKNCDSKIDVKCPEHGLYTKSAEKHLTQICPKCSLVEKNRSGSYCGGYNELFFEQYPDKHDIESFLYLLEINEGHYYKVGITTKSAHERLCELRSKSKGQIKTIRIIKELPNTLFNCYTKEQELLEEFKEHRIYRRWSTELFDINISEYVKF
jgi:hypothetical protein